MRRVLLVVAFCLMMLTSCQSNEVNDTSSEVSTAATFESTISEEAEQSETEQTEVTSNLNVKANWVELYNAIVTPENNEVPVDQVTLKFDVDEPVQLTVHSMAIDLSSYEALNPVTPLYQIEADGKFFDAPVILTYPHEEEDEALNLAFYYDEELDSIEMLPYRREKTYTAFYTHHFSNIFIARMRPGVLEQIKAKEDIVTPFKVGVDDFSFVNNGSYVAPGGHCDGQSQAAMWYFKHIRSKNMGDASLALHNLYDNNLRDFRTPKFWRDDSWLYRFASSVQRDNRYGYIFGLLHLDSDVFPENGANVDQQTFEAFYLSMHLTNRPQLVWIWTDDGESGHAMIVYGIKGNKMLIADPNYPGVERTIEIENGRFKPYSSALNAREIAAGKGINFTEFQYLGEFSTVDEGQIAKRWNEVVSGQLSNDYFPYFAVISDTGNVCVDKYRFYVEPTDHALDDFRFIVYNQSLELLALSDSTELSDLMPPFEMSGIEKVSYVLDSLEPGENTIGILVEGRTSTRTSYEWAGFEWFTIYNDTNLILEAEKTSIKPGEASNITAKMESGVDVANLIRWFMDDEEVDFSTDTYVFEASDIGEYVIEAEVEGTSVRQSITIEVTDNPIEPVAEIPLTERSMVSGTYSCTFSLSSYQTEAFTKFSDDPWYTAAQKAEMAKESAARLQEAFSDRVGVEREDRDNFRVSVYEDGSCSINFSDFLGFEMAFYSVGQIPFNGGNVAFETTREGKEYSGIVQFEITDEGVLMSGTVKRFMRENQYNCYVTSVYTFEGKKVE